MAQKQKTSGRAVSMPVGLILGGLCSLIITASGSMAIAKLISMSIIEIETTGYYVMVMLMISSFMGAIFAKKKIKRRNLVVCLATGVVYIAILMMITILLFDSQFMAVPETILVVMCGSMLAAMFGIRNKPSKKGRKIKISNC